MYSVLAAQKTLVQKQKGSVAETEGIRSKNRKVQEDLGLGSRRYRE